MKFEIIYNTNNQLWKLKKIAEENGYHKTNECYWSQIFENENGDSIVTTREDIVECIDDPAEHLEKMLHPETAQEKTDRENREHCKRIAEELEEYAEGLVYTCPECGSICTIEEDENDDGETIYKTSCGCCLEDEPDEQLSVLDFIQDAYDIEYRVGSDREYRSVKIMVACGGPNIYIDTARRLVTLHWWTDYAEYPISSTACDALDEYMQECWEVM